MKNLLIVLPLLFATPACGTLGAVGGVAGAVLEVPEAVVGDISAVGETITPGEEAVVSAVSTAAQTGGTLIGGPAVGAAAGAVATLLAGFFIRKRKKAAA